REVAENFSTLAKQNGLSFHQAFGALLLGQVALEEGALEDGVKASLQGSGALKASGEIVLAQEANAFLAQAFLMAGRPTEGLAVADEAIVAANQLQIRRFEAELHRLKGELLILAGASREKAESSMRRAIAVERRQEARGWELRATTSLARLLCDNNRLDEARVMLAEIYNWFTEGFDTADLKDAKALLEQLGAAKQNG